MWPPAAPIQSIWYLRPLTLVILTVFQFLTVIQLMIGCDHEYWKSICMSYGITALVMWGLFIFNKLMHRSGFEVETVAFFLCSMGLAVMASVSPNELTKTVLSMVLGIILFMFIGFCMRELETAKSFGIWLRRWGRSC